MNPESKTIEEIKEEIENLGTDNGRSTEETLTKFLDTIATVKDELVQLELYSTAINQLKHFIVVQVYENADQLTADIEKFKNIFTNANLNLTELLLENGFTYDDIMKERQEKGIEFVPTATTTKKEIEIIEERIAEIEDKYLNLLRYNVFSSGLNVKLEELNDSLKNTSDEEEIENLKTQIENLEKDIKTLEEGNKTREEIVEVANKYGISIEEIENRIKAANPEIKEELHSVEELNQEIMELDEELRSNTEELDKVDKEIATLEAEISSEDVDLTDDNLVDEEVENELKEEYKEVKKRVELAELNPEDCMYPEFNQDKQRLVELEKEIANLPENKVAKLMEEYKELKEKVELAELNPEDCMYPAFNQDKQRLAELEKEIANLPENKVAKLMEEYKELKEKVELAELNPEDCMYPGYSQDKQRLVELEKELAKYKNRRANGAKKQRLAELYERKTLLQNSINEINEKLNVKGAEKLEAQELANLKAIKNAYNTILIEATNRFGVGNNDTDLLNNIEEFVKSHPQSEVFNNYERKDKLEKELIDDIYNKVKGKKVTDTKENPKLWAKVLAGAAGFVAGLGASCVPGVGTIKMGLFGLHLLHEGAEIFADTFKESKITKLYNAAKERYQNSVVAKAYKKLRSKPLVRIALGGFTVGYIAGNVYELIKGETLLETLKDDNPEIDPGDVVIDEEPTPDDTKIDDTRPDDTTIEEIISEDITIDTPKPGDVHDLSEIDYGYKSSDAEEAVHLMQNIGNEFEFEKIEKLADGRERWHYKQLNGEGYAWFDKEKVVEVLKKQAKEAAKISSGRTM